MNFIAIDFETANSERGSACEIGMVKVINFKITEEKSFLIKPKDNYFDWYNTELHGIDEAVVKNEPEFDLIYEDLRSDFNEYPVIAHNASFDMSVLRHTLDLYDIEYPSTVYSCTYQMAKEHLPNLFSLRLDAVCKYYEIPLEHHRALPDARACANLAIRIFKERQITKFEEIESSFNLRLGNLFPGGYKGSLKSSKGIRVSDIEYDQTKFDENNIFYNSHVCFTGTLKSMVRIEAQKIVLEIGGQVSKGITGKTNYLVVGEQDYKQYGEGFKSSKMKKAEKMLESGKKIELITERQFIEMISN